MNKAEAIQVVRALLARAPGSADVGTLLPIWYLQRPNRSLPHDYGVYSFFVLPERADGRWIYQLLDPMLKLALADTLPKLRWRDGGVREYDGLVLDVRQEGVEDFIKQDISTALFGEDQIVEAPFYLTTKGRLKKPIGAGRFVVINAAQM